jgi:hypothetical protein
VSVFVGNRQSLDVGFEGLGAATCVQLKIAYKHSEFEYVARFGCESEAPCCKRYRLVVAEQDRLRFSRRKIGARSLAIGGAVQVFSPQHRIISKDHSSSTVQLALPRIRE